MTIKTLLTNSHIDHLDAELLISHVLQKTREYVVAHMDDEVGTLRRWKIKRLFKQRHAGIPLAHLTNNKAFYGFDFFVNKHVLVPRPETELLVDAVLDKLQTLDFTLQTLIDVGTGSGCIPISILNTIASPFYQGGVRGGSHTKIETRVVTCFATDVSKDALVVARKNAQKHHADITLLHGNLLEPVQKIFSPPAKGALEGVIITANLPYLTQQQFDEESSIQDEPKIALVADDGGLALYESLLQQLSVMQNRLVHCLFEIDPTQSSAIVEMIKKYFPDAKVEIKKDLAGLERVVCMEIG